MEKSKSSRSKEPFSDILKKIESENKPTPEQTKVIDSDVKHLLVIAGAGSGKTTTLVRRILALRYSKEIPPQNILGLTFTVKATRELENKAVELAEKILKEAKEATTKLPSEEIGNLEEYLGPEQGSIRVQTYDAFIQGIVRDNGLLIGINPQMSLLSPAGIYQCIAQVCEDNYDLINRCYNDIATEYPDFSLPPLIHKADSFSEDLQTSIKKFSGQVLNFLIDEDHLDFSSALRGVRDWNTKWLKKLNELLQKQKETEIEICEKEKRTNKDYEAAREQKNLVKEAKNAHDKAKKELTRVKTIITNIETLICKARLRDLVIDLSEKYSEVKQKENLAEFGDFTLYALKLVTVTGIAQFYRDKYKYVFLDEYQDTNHTQGLLLKKLFGDGDSTYVTAVGDSQQAIYGFRGSAPGAFDYFRNNFGVSKAQGNELSLSTTFRNRERVVNLANCITGLHLDREDQLSLKPLPAEKNDEEICALAYKDGNEENYGPRAIWEFVNEEDYQKKKIAVLGRNNNDLPAYRDLLEEKGIRCILTGKATFDAENPISRDLTYFLAVCSDPFAVYDTEYLLTSPRYGLSMEGLHVLAEEVKKKNSDLNKSLGRKLNTEDSKAKSNSLSPEPLVTLPLYLDLYLERASESFKKLCKNSDIKILEKFKDDMHAVKAAIPQGIEATVSTAWSVLDFNADVGIAEFFGRLPYEKLTLDDALEAARSYESDLAGNQTPSLQGFLTWLSDYEKDHNQNASGENGTVELMTIHQAKGLEWDAVAVVGMDGVPKRGNTSSQELSFREDGFLGENNFWKQTWINSCSEIPQNQRADLNDCDKRYQEACKAFNDLSDLTVEELSERIDALCHAEIRRDEVEEAHTSYVAMTRTKGDLLLVSQVTGNSDFKVDNLRKTTCTGMFWVDAVNFILTGNCCTNTDSSANSEEWNEGINASSTKEHGFAIYSTGEKLKKALESQLKLPPEVREEDEYAWPLQIKEKGCRNILEKSRDFAIQISRRPENEWNGGELLNKAQRLLRVSKLQNRALRVERTKSLSGTALQDFLADPDKALNSILRPMPHSSKKAAEAGTEFHEWAAAQLDPSNNKQGKIDGENKDEIAKWQEVFLASKWPAREVYSVEKAYTVQVPGISDPITAKMDAVFKGNLKGGDLNFKLTIVDWKTGKMPRGKDRKEKLLQLDIYRLVLSRALDKDINDIDACLYYVSATSGENPQIDAEDKSEDEILERIMTAEGLCARSNDEQEGE